jgi:uncharacterized protein YacL
MTHYEKLAAMIFRILGAFLLILGILIAVMALISIPVVQQLFPALIFIIFYSIPLAILGIYFFSTSRKLAKRVCFDFDKLDE